MLKWRRIIATAVILVLLSVIMLACSGGDKEKEPVASQESTKPVEETKNTEQSGTAGYPLQTTETLEYWADINGNVLSVSSNLKDVPFFQEWQKRTGITLQFTSPAANQAQETLNVMLASGELPDMIEYDWKNFPGGPEKAINDGYILPLNDLINEHAPNLKKYLEDHPDIDKQVKTDNGNYYVFPFIRGDDLLKTYQGPIVRKDWLDDLGLAVPETIEEWYVALKAFKEQKKATAPLSFHSVPSAIQGLGNGAWIGAWGIKKSFYMDNGEIKYGPLEPGYKDFLATMRTWYSEGLLDRNIATVDGKILDANMTSGKTGATVWNSGSGIGKWLPPLKESDPKANLVAAPYPVLNKGDKPKFGQKDFGYASQASVAITTSSKNPELAVKLLDYAYSPEGHLLFNFGTEGVSYNMVDGYPKYTDLVMKNPDNLAPAQALSQYVRSAYNGPFIQDKRYIEQYLALPQQKDAIGIWSNTDTDLYNLPPITPTPEESSEFSSIMNDVDTLVNEMTLKIILGTEPIDAYEDYVKKLKSVNIDRAIEIQKAALERFNKR